MNVWKLLNGKKTTIASVLLIMAEFTDQVVIGMWNVDWPALVKSGDTAGWFGMAMGGVGLAHKWTKRQAANGGADGGP